jgi:hypothetical protein
MLIRRVALAALVASVFLRSASAWASSASQTRQTPQTPTITLDPVLSYSTYLRLPPGAAFGRATGRPFSAANASGEVCVSVIDDLDVRPGTVAKLGADGSLAYMAELPDTESPNFSLFQTITAVAIDTTGNCYVALTTPTSGPTVANVIKLDTTGLLVYSYKVGGSGSVFPAAIAVDTAGEAYVSGSAQEVDFPVANAFQSTYGGGGSDGFLLKLDASGSTLLFSTYLGGTGYDAVGAMALDSAGNVVVVGGSTSANFPLSGTPIVTSGSTFIARFTSSGTLSYSTFLPLPSTVTFALGVALDPTGAAYVLSTSITKVNSTGSAIVYSFSGPVTNYPNSPYAIAVDSSGQAYVAGRTPGALPTVAPIQSAFQGGFSDAFVFILDRTGANILFSTYLGGPGSLPGLDGSFNEEAAVSVNLDSSGNIYVSGVTGGAFPIVNAADGAYLPFPTCYKDSQGGNCGSTYTFVSKISQTSATVLALPSSVGFENISVGSTSATVGVLLANVGSTAISLGSVQISGDYALTNNCPATLTVAASCLLDVTFTPQVAGTRTGSIVVNDNAGGPHTINLTGTGTGFVTAFPTIVNFGNQPVGTNSPSQLVNLTNSSTLFPAVTVTNVQTTGDFTSTGCVPPLGGPASLNPQSQCLIFVVFSPTATGVRSGTLTITDSDPSSPQIVTLTGIGIPAATGGSGSVSVSPAALNFGNQLVGSTSGSQSATITNAIQVSVTLSINKASGDFAENNNCPATLTAGATCTITITFAPTAVGGRTGSVAIMDSGSPSSLSISLAGTGVASGSLGMAIASGSASSVTVSAGQVATYNLVIGGTGSSGSVSLSCNGAPKGATCGAPASLTLGASTPTNFAVTVTTTSRTLTGQNNTTTLPWLWAAIVMGCFFGFRKTRAGLATLLIAACLLAGCGGSGSSTTPPPATNPNGTPAGTYTITLTATTSSASQSVNLTLVVN